MKLFAIAFGISCGVAVIFFAAAFTILTLVGLGQPWVAAAALAALPISAFTKIAEFLEQQESKKGLAAGKRRPMYDFRGFQIAWPLMVLYGTIVLMAIMFAVSYYMGWAYAQLSLEQGLELAPFTTVPAWILAAYFIGYWIGTRCADRGVVAILLIGLLTAIGIEMPVAKPSDFLTQGAFNIVIFTGPALLGYWRGRRQRWSKYLHYLLGVLPSDTRNTVVEMTFEEAQKVVSTAGRSGAT